jgi:hypothetical protein
LGKTQKYNINTFVLKNNTVYSKNIPIWVFFWSLFWGQKPDEWDAACQVAGCPAYPPKPYPSVPIYATAKNEYSFFEKLPLFTTYSGRRLEIIYFMLFFSCIIVKYLKNFTFLLYY